VNATTDAVSAAATAAGAPLRGIRVVEVSNTFMVPYATLLMAQMGAEVVKVEEPGGDILRQVGDVTGTGAGPMFLNANRGKKSVVLDLRDDADHRRLQHLVRQADVFVHNRTPAAAQRLRIDYASLQPLNPRMIHCGASGYGSDGPYRDLPAYDDIIQAASGIAAVQTHDGPPQYVRTVLTDKATGLFVLAAVLAALVERARSGMGQAVEVPMFESMISFLLLEQQGGAVYDPPRGPTGYARVNSPHRHPHRRRADQRDALHRPPVAVVLRAGRATRHGRRPALRHHARPHRQHRRPLPLPRRDAGDALDGRVAAPAGATPHSRHPGQQRGRPAHRPARPGDVPGPRVAAPLGGDGAHRAAADPLPAHAAAGAGAGTASR
jgi:hypothetical protein